MTAKETSFRFEDCSKQFYFIHKMRIYAISTIYIVLYLSLNVNKTIAGISGEWV